MSLFPLDEIIFTPEDHTYEMGRKRYTSVTQIINQTLGDPFIGIPQDRLEFCQGRGNAVHLAAALLTAGRLNWKTVDPRIEGYVRAVERFHKDCPGEVIAAEKRLVAKSYGLAGTPDIIKFISGRRALVDYKTSQQMKPRMRLQTAGYKILWNDTHPQAPIQDRYGLRLSPDGTYKLVRHDDLDDECAFEILMQKAASDQAAEPWIKKYA